MQDKIASLDPKAVDILVDKGTEPPGSGKFVNEESKGTYLCRRCGRALFRSTFKFTSSCGWPSFDDEIVDSIEKVLDADAKRTEIMCHRCKSHLGHIFFGENYTSKDKRNCVNSLSVDFCNSETLLDSRELIVAGGCFWGVEHYMKAKEGVVFTEAGYIGGQTESPTYKDVSGGQSAHLEAVRIIFDPEKTNDERLLKHFFEIHDPTQENGQGNDRGHQYQSAVFFYDLDQKTVVESLLKILQKNGFSAVTKLIPVSIFWAAEKEHQNYLSNNPKGHCTHSFVKRFT